MSDFTQTMAQMVARARTPQAPGGGGGQRFFGGGVGGMGIKGNRTETTASASFDIGQAKKMFGHMTPEMKDDAFKKMQTSWERMVAQDPESAEMWRRSKDNQKVLEKLYAGGFPIKKLADGTFSTGIRSPEQKAYDDPKWSMERGKAGLYNETQNEKVLRGYNAQTPTQNQGTSSGPSAPSMYPTQPHRLDSTGGPVRPHRTDQPSGQGQSGMAGGLEQPTKFSERVQAADNYKSPHDRSMDNIRLKTALQEQQNAGLGIKRDTAMYEKQLQTDINENDLIAYQHDLLRQKEARETNRGMSDDDYTSVQTYRRDYTTEKMGITAHRNALGGRATWDQKADSTADLMGAVETAVGGTLGITDNPKYSASYLQTVMSEIDILMGSNYEKDTSKIPWLYTDMEEALPSEDFQLKMGDLVTRFGKIMKRVKLTDEEDGVYYENVAKWACDEKLGFKDSDATAFLLGLGMGKGWTKEEMERNKRQYTGPLPKGVQPAAEPVQPEPEKKQTKVAKPAAKEKTDWTGLTKKEGREKIKGAMSAWENTFNRDKEDIEAARKRVRDLGR